MKIIVLENSFHDCIGGKSTRYLWFLITHCSMYIAHLDVLVAIFSTFLSTMTQFLRIAYLHDPGTNEVRTGSYAFGKCLYLSPCLFVREVFTLIIFTVTRSTMQHALLPGLYYFEPVVWSSFYVNIKLLRRRIRRLKTRCSQSLLDRKKTKQNKKKKNTGSRKETGQDMPFTSWSTNQLSTRTGLLNNTSSYHYDPILTLLAREPKVCKFRELGHSAQEGYRNSENYRFAISYVASKCFKVSH